MNPKHWLGSKTLWVNTLGGIVSTVGMLSGVIPMKYAPAITAVGGIANILLRLVTSQPLTTGDPGQRVDVSKVSMVLLAAALALPLVGCAWLKAQPPKTLVLDALVAAEWGVKADHDFGVNWLSDADVAQFEKLDGIVRDVAESDPVTVKAAAHQAVVSFEARELAPDSKLKPYVEALAAALA